MVRLPPRWADGTHHRPRHSLFEFELVRGVPWIGAVIGALYLKASVCAHSKVVTGMSRPTTAARGFKSQDPAA